MTRRRVPRWLLEYVKDSLVDEELDEKFDAIAPRLDIPEIRWRHRNGNKTNLMYTPYGDLEIEKTLGGYTVSRDRAPLVHARCPSEGLFPAAVFTRMRGARAAGLIHVQDGFGEEPPFKDGLWWRISGPATEIIAPLSSGDFMDDQSVPDDHQWGRKHLDQLLKKSGIYADAPNENLVLDVEAFASWWQLDPPRWSCPAVGRFELKTPYGNLVVRRLIGWTVERNGVPLCWHFRRDPRVIFESLEHAKTIALACASTWGAKPLPIGGVRWGQRDHDHVIAPLQPLSANFTILNASFPSEPMPVTR
jgi:hypothetical protein